MIVSIHQPQYIPWLPYFLKIQKSDIFILLDSVDFQKNGLQNRNQIKTANGPCWLTVPVKHKSGQKIYETQIDSQINWAYKHLNSIKHSYSKAKYFSNYEVFLEKIYTKPWDSLSELNFEFITQIMKWMDIKTPILRSSQMNSVGAGSELILNLCKEVGASRYISGLGGKNYLNEEEFQGENIEIIFYPPVFPKPYSQTFPKINFLDNISSIDIILNCGEDWRLFLPQDL